MCACVYLSLAGQDGSVFEIHAQRIHKKQTENIDRVCCYV